MRVAEICWLLLPPQLLLIWLQLQVLLTYIIHKHCPTFPTTCHPRLQINCYIIVGVYCTAQPPDLGTRTRGTNQY
ncbi:uncharacterized protein BP01DRAFT_356038 [Aspergillus saccharolyticus JOP 1030-1]|uniref:Uncharacterized protein n=1 Tax=Aspergillus saccharolyticus JOP 1030-1 TaxID=1450539 RepID=A0A318ZPI5_9EURO|nr:hypothetical protein BP01DRAFT_356038 [Aspergillus saccharolyticus JOP 1030-1]PYH45830.1 hypothetical protein BP01DRAFT_356038 [Aspergillus saccharolyticus JOP 1030-1]